ncbi:wax ester synthase/diacylglycerol acyltransferase 10-like isoform X3 [Wolffia australiana]
MLLISVFEAKYTLYRMEDKTSIAGGLRVYRMPRKLATLSLSMDDMIIVKNKLNAKVNDVFAGIVTYGVEKYLRFKSPEDLLKDPVISFGSASSVRKQGAKLPERLYNRMVVHTTVGLSNIMGPSKPISLKGNQVTKIGVTISKLSSGLQVHMISYNQKAYLQFLVASEIIPDPDRLCIYVDEAFVR